MLTAESLVGARVHIVGIGGAGMSGLALLLVEMGARVSGSDAVGSAVLDHLRDRGVTVHVGHDRGHGVGADVVSWSPAVARDNVEVASAVANGAVPFSRAEILARLGQSSRIIGLTGTHGKTTATSMMAHVMNAAGRDCSRLLGAPVLGLGDNGHWGDGDLILEVDESYGTFSLLSPFALGVLNVEADHLDHYGSLELLERAFAALIDRTTGPVVVWADDPGIVRVVTMLHRTVVVAGTTPEASWRVDAVQLSRQGANFRITHGDEEMVIALCVTGAHNVANASVVAVLAREFGLGTGDIVRGLAAFKGAPRRFQYRGSWRGIDVYEDYAHLPGEITATIEATRSAGYQRIGVVFQPHRVTRTLNLNDAFATAFDGAARLVVTDIYTAGEPNPTGVTGEFLVRAMIERQSQAPVAYCPSLDHVVDVVEAWHDDVDVILFLGAGNVADVAPRLPGGLD
ncbi:MAG TPA: UDP-N-acetylmuramate--L-alanine ligase [Acidimicrobiales bacterium]|nr:UDP-N-acetylmuramate--L-alanine ligase [Acidimicrobiales bacterium]